MSMPIVRVILTWLFFLPVPFVNGLLREKWYKSIAGDTAAHIIGTVVTSFIFLLFVYLSFKNQVSAFSTSQLFAIGGIWLALTLIFEFGMGLAAGRSWAFMLSDYNVFKGRIWPFLLLVVFFSPHIIKMVADKLSASL